MGNYIVSNLVFQPPTPSYRPNSDIEWVNLSNGVKLPVRLLRSSKSNTVLLYSHGNACDMGQMFQYLDFLRNRLRVNVACYEYPGYGASTPRNVGPSESSLNESIEKAVEWLKRCGFESTDILLFGCSLGSGPSVWMASQDNQQFGGLILQSAFQSVVTCKTRNFVATAFDMFKNINHMPSVRCPVFFIHGKFDDVVPFTHAMNLYEKTPEEHRYVPLWIEYAGHNNIMEVYGVEPYLRKLRQFIVHCEKQNNGGSNTERRATASSSSTQAT